MGTKTSEFEKCGLTEHEMKVCIRFKGKLLFTIICPRSITDPEEAVAMVKQHLQVVPDDCYSPYGLHSREIGTYIEREE